MFLSREELTPGNDLHGSTGSKIEKQKLEYRRELDGLLALAVIGVLLYHGNLRVKGISLLQGGFPGVDIFFVLSGFLITGIICHAMDNNDFTFRNFYIRRIKRIVPAYLFILAVIALAAYIVILPSELVKFAESLKSALYFGSNYFFYGEDSYTAVSSINKPLLHTWSLSVEWPFYIIFSFLSCVLVQWASKNSSDFAFHLLPSKAWELLFGGALVLVNHERMFSACSGIWEKLTRWLPFVGLVLVMASMIFISDKPGHPSFLMLLPVTGTILFILFYREGEMVSRFFSSKPFVFLGLIFSHCILVISPFRIFEITEIFFY